jgi:hypothetical protein
MRNALISSLLVLLLFSCRKENAFDCFKPNGAEVSEIRFPGEFTSVEVYDKINLVIYQGPEMKVEVIAGKNILKNISTNVSSGVLRVENLNTCNFVRGYKKVVKINITLPYLSKITNYGVGPVTIENFKQDTLRVRNENSGDTYINGTYTEVWTSSHGNGDVYLSGSAKSLQIYSNGTNYTRAENFSVSDYLYISTYSIGDAYLNLEGVGKFDYYIWRDGNIYYTGTPKSIYNLGSDSAAGKVIKLD